MLRLQRNLLAFSVGFFLMAGLMLTAYASTATGPNGLPITFQGDDCRELTRGVVRAQSAADPANPLPYVQIECDRDTVAPGAVVSILWRSKESSGSFPVTVGTVDQKDNEGGYLGFIGLVCCYGIGLLAGLQR